MTEDEIRNTFLESLVQVAPDLEKDSIGDTDHLQDDLGLDSMDILNLVTLLFETFNVNVPEEELRSIQTPGLAVTYLSNSLRAVQ